MRYKVVSLGLLATVALTAAPFSPASAHNPKTASCRVVTKGIRSVGRNTVRSSVGVIA